MRDEKEPSSKPLQITIGERDGERRRRKQSSNNVLSEQVEETKEWNERKASRSRTHHSIAQHKITKKTWFGSHTHTLSLPLSCFSYKCISHHKNIPSATISAIEGEYELKY